MVTKVRYKTSSYDLPSHSILIFFVIHHHKKGKIYIKNNILMTSLLMTIFDELIMRLNEKESCYKEKSIEILRNTIFCFCFVFLLKKFIFKKSVFFLSCFCFSSCLLLYLPSFSIISTLASYQSFAIMTLYKSIFLF